MALFRNLNGRGAGAVFHRRLVGIMNQAIAVHSP